MEFGPFLKIKLVEEEQRQRLDVPQPTSKGALRVARLHLQKEPSSLQMLRVTDGPGGGLTGGAANED